MNFKSVFNKNITHKQAEVLSLRCYIPEISDANYLNHVAFLLPLFETKLLIDGKVFFSDSRKVYKRAEQNKTIEVDIVETTFLNKKSINIK